MPRGALRLVRRKCCKLRRRRLCSNVFRALPHHPQQGDLDGTAQLPQSRTRSFWAPPVLVETLSQHRQVPAPVLVLAAMLTRRMLQ